MFFLLFFPLILGKIEKETLNYDIGVIKILSPDKFISRSINYPIVKIKNFGLASAENFSVKFFISALNYVDTKNISYLPSFAETLLYFRPFIPQESINFLVKCTVDFPLDENPNNNLKIEEIFVYDYFENFENENHGFIAIPAGGFNLLNWGRNNDRCFVTADRIYEDYHDMANFRLITPPFFALVDTPIIAYWHKYNTEFNWDGYNVKCSTDNSSWQILHAHPILGERYSTIASIYTLGIRGESCYSGFNDWRINFLKIPVLRNEKFFISFHFGSDNAWNEEGGVFIDNIYGIGFSPLAPYLSLEIKELVFPKEPVARTFIFPQVKIKNYSPNSCENILLHLRISPGNYFSERRVVRLSPLEEVIVRFDNWYPCSTFNLLQCSLYYYPENYPEKRIIHSLKKEIFVYDYYEDFENNNGNFLPNPTSGWWYGQYFGLPNNPGGWSTAYYPPMANFKLISPTFYSLIDTPIIAYWHKYENEYRFDGYNVKCSIFDNNWQILSSLPHLGNPYDTIARPGNAGIANESCYAGYYPWRLNYLKIPVEKGEYFKINFHFGSDYVEDYYGTEIDKIYGIGFIKLLVYDVGIETIIVPEKLNKKETINPIIKIKNYGQRDAHNFSVILKIPPRYNDTLFIQSLPSLKETLLIFSPFYPYIVNPFYKAIYTAECKVNFPLDEKPENNQLNFDFYVYRYYEDFEANNGGYFSIPESGWKYSLIEPYNLGWKTGIYEDSANWKLVSPPFTALFSYPWIAYYHKFAISSGDGYNLKCSLTTANRWQIVENDYNGEASPTNAGIPNEPCFTGRKDWELVFFELPVGIGQRFYLSFHFGSDEVNNDSGVVIDKIYGIGFDTSSVGIAEDFLEKEKTINLSKKEKVKIEVFDISGRIVYRKEKFLDEIVIKKSLPKGVYFLKIISPFFKFKRKIVIK